MGVAHLAQYDLSSEFKRLGYADLNKSFLSIPEIKRILQQHYEVVYNKYPKIIHKVLPQILQDIGLPLRTEKISTSQKHTATPSIIAWLKSKGIVNKEVVTLTRDELKTVVLNNFTSLTSEDFDILNQHTILKRIKKEVKKRNKVKSKPVNKSASRVKKSNDTIHVAGVDVTSKEFLNTWEWKTIRYEVLVEQGAKCKCCGATAKEGITINVDHIKPRKTHPKLALYKNNLQVLCSDCNMGKGNWDSTDWRTV